MATASLKVSGMKCGGCENTVQTALNALAGVQAAKAHAKEGTVEVEFDDATTTLDAIKQAISAAGFAVA